jgi:hypothetical protein
MLNKQLGWEGRKLIQNSDGEPLGTRPIGRQIGKWEYDISVEINCKNGTGSHSYPVAGFGIGAAESSNTRVIISLRS